MILSVDGGINCCGCALFKGYELHRAWLVRSVVRTEASFLERCVLMARGVMRSLTLEEIQTIKVFVGEWPQIYTRNKSKGNPNTSLVPLAGVIAAIAAQLPAAKVVQYLPREWKGTADGDQFTEYIKRRLTEGELEKVQACPPSLAHNVFDGIGLGLMQVGRLEKVRVISRGKTI